MIYSVFLPYKQLEMEKFSQSPAPNHKVCG